MKAFTSVALGLLGMASAASATTWSVVDDFSTSSPTGVWSYGVNDGSGFSPFTTYSALDILDVAGWNLASVNPPYVGRNTLGVPIFWRSIFAPADMLDVHPGDTVDTQVVWTAPSAGHYSIWGRFAILDENASGVQVSITSPLGTALSAHLTSPTASQALARVGESAHFNFGLNLSAGDKIAFTVNNDGSYRFDSTGLSAFISDAPEPQTWTMLIAGSTLSGLVMRRRRRDARRTSSKAY